jgi:hypothetical protein
VAKKPHPASDGAEANDVIARVLAPRVEEAVAAEAAEGVAEAPSEAAAEADAEG